MKFNECINFLKELSRFDNIYLTIDSNDNLLEDVLFDDLTIADLRPFEGKNYTLSFDGLYDGNIMNPSFKMTEFE